MCVCGQVVLVNSLFACARALNELQRVNGARVALIHMDYDDRFHGFHMEPSCAATHVSAAEVAAALALRLGETG